MVHIIWEYRIHPDKRAEFEQHYARNGVWVELFRRSSAFQDSVLIQDVEHPDHYVTIDTWHDMAAYRRFRETVESEYQALDEACEQFTLEERLVGAFEVRE